MTVVIVDWLGRGGIAQTTDAWATELAASGHRVVVVTRPGRELSGDTYEVVGPAPARDRLRTHWALARFAREVISAERPASVLIQNYVLPPLEGPAYRAAYQTRSRLVVVAHDHRLHSVAAGTGWGLRAKLRSADVVVAHSPFVAERVAAFAGRDVEEIPHPLPLSLLREPDVPDARLDDDDTLLAVHFGVLKRGYKGTRTVAQIAERGVAGWRFAALGNGAPTASPGLTCVPGFLPPGVLVSAVRRSAATVLPYRIASQSGAIVLAQALGSVPIAAAVGGIPSQITDGVTGRLLPASAGIDEWARILTELRDPQSRATMAEKAGAAVAEAHREFARRAVRLVQ